MKTNFTYINSGFYIIRTQAGFKNALTHYFKDRTWADIKSMLIENNYPKSYPSLINVGEIYYGKTYIYVDCLHINKLLASINESEELNRK